jgi:alpha/beta superfamily hydrolase
MVFPEYRRASVIAESESIATEPQPRHPVASIDAARKMMIGMNAAGSPSQTSTRAAETSTKESSPAERSWTPALRAVSLTGPAGRLEGLLNSGAPDAGYAALVCHPNPAYGGTMHHKVVYRAMKVMNNPEWGLGWPVLRFNFRGTGLSEGAHDGKAEVEDVVAALDWLTGEFQRPIVLGGFSFGAAMALWAACGLLNTRNVRAIFALGLPARASGREYHYRFLHDASIPKLFLSGDSDAFGPVEQLREIVSAASEPKRLVLIPGADHFFTDHLEPMQQSLASWIKEQLQ